jgi:hypothetical protein
MRFALRFLLLALALCAAAGCQMKKTELKPFSPAEGRFTVMVPKPMTHASSVTRWGAADVDMHSYSVEQDGVKYAVNYFDIPVDISDAMRSQMKSNSLFPGREELVIAQQWTVKDVNLAQTWPGRNKHTHAKAESFQATSANGKQVLSVRLVWYENRIYQVTVAHRPNPSFFQGVSSKEFFNSFQLL